jgi:type IV secretion system protein VirB10
MSDSTPPPEPPKLDPEALVLKAAPRRVIRFKRNLLIGIAAIGCIATFGITWMALRTPHLRIAVNSGESPGTEHKPEPDALSKLPGNYGEMQKPKLGPPLPGDLGLGIVQREKQLGVRPSGPATEDQAARAERLRLAQQAQQARESAVFFRLTQHRAAATAPTPAATPASATTQAPVAAATNSSSNRLNLDLVRDQNDQRRKIDFLNQKSARSIYNDHALQTPASPYEVLAGWSRYGTGNRERLRFRDRPRAAHSARLAAHRFL